MITKGKVSISFFALSQIVSAIWILIEAKLLIAQFGIDWYGISVFINGILLLVIGILSFDVSKAIQMDLMNNGIKINRGKLKIYFILELIPPILALSFFIILLEYSWFTGDNWRLVIENYKVVLIYGLILVFRSSSNIWFSQKRYLNKLRVVSLATLVVVGLKILFWITPFFSPTLNSYLYIYLCIEFGRFLFEMYQLRIHLFDGLIRREIGVLSANEINFLKTTYVVSTTGSVVKKLDSVLIGSFLNSSELATFKIVKMIAQSSNVLTAPLFNYLFIEFFGENPKLNFKYFKKLLSKWLWILVIVIGVVIPIISFYAPRLLTFWNIDMDRSIIAPVFFGLFISEMIRNLFFWVFPSTIHIKKYKWYTNSALISLLLGGLVYALGIWKFGFLGAGLFFFAWQLGTLYLFYKLLKNDANV